MGKATHYVPKKIEDDDELRRVRGATRAVDRAERIAARRRLAQHHDALVVEAVYEAREKHGMSWTAIGEALGISKQATLQRFGPGSALYRHFVATGEKRKKR
jgi:hypothetical protein